MLHSVPQFVVEDDKIRASSVMRRRGGNCPNTIDVLQQLCSIGDKTELAIGLNLVVVLPNRASSAVQEIHRSFGPGVDTTKCIYRDEYVEPSSSYIIKNLASDSRTIISYNTMPDMNLDEFTQIADSFGRGAVWYHFEVSLAFLVPTSIEGFLIRIGSHTRCHIRLYPIPAKVGARRQDQRGDREIPKTRAARACP